jgi:endonuclease/exonuclease/phosphatase family metal-dependent hydrolase
MQLRVLTYNIHKGFCFYSRQYVLQELRKAIREVDADVVFLQEVMGVHPVATDERELNSQFEFLADEIWPHYAYGKNAVYSDGHHGNAILSKHPMIDFENINVSTNPLERRGLLHAQVQLNGTGQPLHLVCLHLDLLERGRRQQMQHLVQSVQRRVPQGDPLIVAGDFNDWKQKVSDPLSEQLKLVEAGVFLYGQHQRTFPSWRPFLSLDRVYVRGLEIKSHQVLADLQWRRMSDHAAVLAELSVPSDKTAAKSEG